MGIGWILSELLNIRREKATSVVRIEHWNSEVLYATEQNKCRIRDKGQNKALLLVLVILMAIHSRQLPSTIHSENNRPLFAPVRLWELVGPGMNSAAKEESNNSCGG